MSQRRLCTAIPASGQRCRGTALDSSEYCYAHSPHKTAEREANAAAGGRAHSRPSSELGQIKARVKSIARDVLEGRVDRGNAAVALQGYNVLLRAVETERKVLESVLLEERVIELETQLEERLSYG